MRAWLAAATAALVLAAPAVAQTPAWQVYRDEALGFSAEFPAAPTPDTRDLPVGDKTVQMHSVIAMADNAVYMVATVDYGTEPESAKASLDAALSGMASSVNGEVVSQQEMVVSGRPAREAVIRVTDGAGELRMKVRVISAGTRLYEALAGGAAPGAPDADRFLKSVTLL